MDNSLNAFGRLMHWLGNSSHRWDDNSEAARVRRGLRMFMAALGVGLLYAAMMCIVGVQNGWPVWATAAATLAGLMVMPLVIIAMGIIYLVCVFIYERFVALTGLTD